MKWFWENQTRRLLGIDGQDNRVAIFKELSKEIRPMFALCFQVTHTEPQGNIHPSMQEILQEFSYQFTKPMSLPLTRVVDHNITLKEGTKSINI
jgi:DNA repair protein RadC